MLRKEAEQRKFLKNTESVMVANNTVFTIYVLYTQREN